LPKLATLKKGFFLNKKILFYSLILSSYVFGMDNTDKKLGLCCVIENEPALISQFFNVTFKKHPPLPLDSIFPTAIVVDDPDCFRVHLPNAVRSYLAQHEDVSYCDCFLTSKKSTLRALQNILHANSSKGCDQKNIIMEINFSEHSDFAHLKGCSCLIESAKLPQSIKSRITDSSSADIQNFYIFLPLALLFLLYRFS
jgi:hypothetical protein